MSYRISERRACRVTRLHRGTYRYSSHKNGWTALRMRIREIAQTRVRYGYRKIRVLLNREGWEVGKTLVQRLYQEEGLALKQRPKRRKRAAEPRGERIRATEANQAWSLDFVADQLSDGRRFRALTIVDVFTRESLAIRVGQALKGTDVVDVLNRLRFERRIVTFACALAACILAHEMTLRHFILYLLSLNPFGVSRALLCTFESSRSPVAIRHGQSAASVPIQGYGSLIVTAGNN
jgi:transposase InsO family protein